MSLRSVYLGHWRALERKWLELFLDSHDFDNTAVVTAGYSQTARLASLIPGTISGTRFYPGIPLLARALSGRFSAPTVPQPLSIAMASRAGYTAGTARAAGAFFEDLLDKGITPEAFMVNAMSLRGGNQQVMKVAAGFAEYAGIRASEIPFTRDMAVLEGPPDPVGLKSVFFYGFYDLNPGQRRYVEALAGSTDLMWFSPVHPAHHWRDAFQRTLDFLKALCPAGRIHRADADTPLNHNGQFCENLLTGKALQPSGSIVLKRCGCGTAFARAVADEIRELGAPWSDLAVVASGERSESIVRSLYEQGIPCGTPFSARASTLPWGRFLLRLNGLGDSSYHHREVERLLATGLVMEEGSPDPHEYAKRAAEIGARFGLESLKETGFSFARRIADYHAGIPDRDLPRNYLDRMLQTAERLSGALLPAGQLEVILDERSFRSTGKVSFSVFRKMLEVGLENGTVPFSESESGVRVISMEQARGALFRAVVLTGMTEREFPGRAELDPRLPPEMKKLLQMPSPDSRETERAFMLRQVFEAAGDTLVIMAEAEDEKGNSVPLSPFLHSINGFVKEIQIPSPASATLEFPAAPPFLAGSMSCQRERIGFDFEAPSKSAVHCGMIGPGLYRRDRVTATLLETYIRDTFRFLEEKVWKTGEAADFPVRSEPERPVAGALVHRCVELCLAGECHPHSAVSQVARRNGLEVLLGSRALADIWIANTAAGIERLKEELASRGWCFRQSETELLETVAGIPAAGRVDLILAEPGGGLVLADLKTGRPRGASAENILSKGLLQLPFYMELALAAGLGPVTSTCYIHLQGNGRVTFEEISAQELQGIRNDFEKTVKETWEAMLQGRFPMTKEKRWPGKRS